jgi:DUF1365 family protein
MSLERMTPGATPHVFDATLSLECQPWTSRAVTRALLRHPVMTASVVAGIHWQAARLWWKGASIVPRPTVKGVYPEAAAASGRK